MLDFAAELLGARTMTCIDQIAQDFWKAYGSGVIGEADAERVASGIEEARRRVRPKDTVKIRAAAVPLSAVSMFPPRRRYCGSPNRAKSRARRRRLAYSGPLPPSLAAGFTTGQLATLRIVADEVRAKGACTLTIAEMAARAGVCITTARNAIRLAANDGMLLIVERRRHGAPNLPNVLRVISRDWRAWIARTGGGGCKKLESTEISIKFPITKENQTELGLSTKNLLRKDPRQRIHSSSLDTSQTHFKGVLTGVFNPPLPSSPK